MAAGAVPTVRLFTALWPPAAVRTALASLRDRWQWPAGAARVDAARLHVTLHFLGPVDAQRVPDLVRGLAVPMESAELRLDGASHRLWPGGLAVLELDAPEPLRRLHARLSEALARLGFVPEARAWRPHVTFARKAFGAKPPPAVEPCPPWPVDAYALVRSSGGRYDVLHAFDGRKG
jgi:2'-5' RNA ligase